MKLGTGKIIAAGVALFLAGAAGPVRADVPVEICNRTSLPADCLLASDASGRIEVSGEHRVDAGQCKSFGEVAREVFYHCTQKRYDDETKRWLSSGIWDGDETFCVPQYQKEFKLAQVERIVTDCEAHGYTSFGFDRQGADDAGLIEISLED